jgi:Golgi apparatus protein 1
MAVRRWQLTALLLGALLVGAPFSAAGAELDTEQLEDNEEAQQDGEIPQADVVSQIVEQADDVDLQSGTGDIATTGGCTEDVTRFCLEVKPGEGRLNECLTNQLNDEENGKAADEGGKLSDTCKDEIRAFKAERATNINLDIILAEACKDDAAQFCNDQNLYPEPGAVITCLREVEEKLQSKCKEQVLRVKIEAAKDFVADAMLSELCTDDAQELCADVKAGGGRVQECLRKKRPQLSWDCQEELFRKEVEDAADLRLNPTLLRVCSKDKKTFCSDVKPGMGRAKQCLEDNRAKPDFSPECKAKFEEMMVRRASDFRLDESLRSACRDDIEEVCGYEKDSLDTVAGYDARVIECLQDYRDELTKAECQEAVHKVTARAAEDIRMDRPLADACYEDRKTLCAGVAPGSARVLRCLQDKREQLNYECRATLFDQEVRLAEDIDFKFPMKKACSKEIELFCKDVKHGHARVITCLQEHDEDASMGRECRAEVKRDEVREAEDYRLDYRLNKACDMEIDMLCAEVCSPFQGQACSGAVIDCLRDKQDNITAEACKTELFEVEKRMGNDFRDDAQLKKSCADDVAKFCADVEPGNGKVHECLLNHKAELAATCKVAEGKLQVALSSDVRLHPGFKQCTDEIKVHCKSVKPGQGRMFRCLQESMEKSDFSDGCKKQIGKRQNKMAKNWKLDFGVAKKCSADVDKICAAAKAKNDDTGAVLKCLSENHDSISAADCQTEVARATKMAFWQYSKGAPITAECDEDAQTLCPAKFPTAGQSFKRLGKCITSKAENVTNPACKKLLDISKSTEDDAEFNAMLAKVTIMNKVKKSAEKAAKGVKGAPAAAAAGKGDMLKVTGWMALASIAALVLVVIGGGYYAYKKYTGQDQPYTLVIKGGDA